MRSEIGQLALDHVLKERQDLNANITAAINDAAEAWVFTNCTVPPSNHPGRPVPPL